MAEQHGRNSPEENLQVQPDGPIVDVLKIEFYPGLKFVDLVSTADLPKTRNSRFDAEATPLRRIRKVFHFVRRQRTRTDQTHLSDQNIEKLRQLIDTEFTQPATESA